MVGEVEVLLFLGDTVLTVYLDLKDELIEQGKELLHVWEWLLSAVCNLYYVLFEISGFFTICSIL